MSYCRHCGSELPQDARFCPTCGAPVAPVETKPMETHRTLKVAHKPKVVVTNTVPGSVDVKAGPEGEVTVDLDLKVPEDLAWNISQEGNVVTITCRAKVHPSNWPSYFFTGGPRADMYISVPAETDLDLEARLDRVTVTGVKGNLTAESSVAKLTIQDCEGAVKATARTGQIELKNVNGTISVRNSTGSVDLENVNGTVSVQNSTGPIKFTGSLSKGENWFRTSLGQIELTLQGDPDLRVEASTRLGRVTCDPDLTDARYVRGLLTGRIGAGAGRLIVETRTGSIIIRR